ncbi:uncharacterized protein TNCV_2585831 [Trichonephila clavipes]|nr:uncharacterized protein TNCV_2585831 [Trichonephila clavipes]
MKTSSVDFNSQQPTPSPMKTKHRRFAMLRRIFEPWQWKRRKKRDRFEQTSRTLERKISMRSTKELIKKGVLMPDGTDKDQDSKINDSVHPSVLLSFQNHAMPVKHNVFLWNLPDVEEMPSHDGETTLLWSRWEKKGGRTAADSVQSGWPVMASSKAVFARRRSELKLKLLDCELLRETAERTTELVLAIHPNDHQARRRFVEWAQNEIAVVPDFQKRILFSDEAHFWLNGYVNKQNCRIWSEANPQVYVETPLHPEKLTVWYALWAGGSIGPYFFKNDEGHNVTVNGDRYRAMITNFFISELNNHDVQELWFQKDGTTYHTVRATFDLLKDTFGDRLISRFGPVNWRPRSCDLTPLDYFLWGYVKSLVYADKPQTLDHLEDNIRRVIADIRPQMLEKVIENWTSRLDYIRACRGSPMPEIIFKM